MADTIDYILPGNWLSIPIGRDLDATQAAIHSVVERQVGRRDDLARLRAELRQQLGEAARRAAEASAEQLHIALTLVGDVPFPSTLTVYRPDVRLGDEGDVQSRTERLRSVVPGDAAEALAGYRLPTVRTVHVVEPAAGHTTPGRVDVTYWVSVGRSSGLAVFAFSCALVPFKDQLVELFDAVMLTVVPKRVGSAHR